MLFSGSSNRGYVLIDVLMALLLFSLSFAVVFGLTETANYDNQRVANLTQAINIARNSMERLACRSWTENLANRGCIPGDVVVGSEGLFDWTISAEWEECPNLLAIEMEVKWLEKGKVCSYRLGSLYYVD